MGNMDINIDEIAEKIAKNPYQWVLVLGDIFSECSIDRKKQIIKLLNDNEEIFSDRSQLFDFIINENYSEIANTIFGTVWDGVSFLDSTRERQIKMRNKYANIFCKKETANIEMANSYISSILQAFPGIILTICQDEMFEACWENKRSMSVDERVWTPNYFSSSIMWNRWVEIKNEMETLSTGIVNPYNSEPRLLVKLYGNRKEPSQMLLSSNDFELYYPKSDTENKTEDETETKNESRKGDKTETKSEDEKQTDTNNKTEIYSKRFLTEIFEKKNIIFLGTDTFLMQNSDFPFASGIAEVLKKDSHTERYIFVEKNLSEINWNDYHMEVVDISNDENDKISQLLKEVILKREELWKKKQNDAIDIETVITNDDVKVQEYGQNLFWKLYIRRPEHIISSYERIIVDKIISGDGWNNKNIYLLSMIANNQADFYDVHKIIDEAKKKNANKNAMAEDEYIGQILYSILMDRLGEKSKILSQFLMEYGSGFPMGFFQLLSDNEEELKEWKKAAFQLTNSGIYIQRKNRKYVQKHMEYADIIMKTSKINMSETEIKQMLKELEPQLDDSYFYPFDENYFLMAKDDEISETVGKLIVKMLKNMLNVFEDKYEGYNRIRSLIETEINNVIKIIISCNYDDLNFKIELIYYLLCESRALPVEEGILYSLNNYIHKLINNLQNSPKSGFKQKKQFYSNKIKLIISYGILSSQSCDNKKLKSVLKRIEHVEKDFEDYKKDVLNERNVLNKRNILTEDELLDRDFFKLKIQIILLKSKINLRIIEIKQYLTNSEISMYNKQEDAIKKIRDFLQNLEKIIKKRRETTGYNYNELIAESYNLYGKFAFIASSFFMDYENNKYFSTNRNKKYYKKAQAYYDDAYKYYTKALEYYKKYPDKYMIQCADVMRNMADLFYKKPINQMDENDKEKCYDFLIKSYILYRKGSDLHGIADVLQGLGNAECVFHLNKEKRSPLSFYDMAINLYRQLGDEYSRFVTQNLRKTLAEKRQRNEQ